jgi:hypothetical protein
MINSHERSIKPFTAAEGFLGKLCPIKVTYWVFRSPESQLKISLISEDDVLRMAKSWKMTTKIGQIPASDKPESQKRI